VSSLSSFDAQYETEHWVATDLWTKPTGLNIHLNWQLQYYIHHWQFTIYYNSIQKLILILPSRKE